MSEPRTRVVIVDDQQLIRTGFALILNSADGVEVVGEAGDGQAAFELLQSIQEGSHPPDVVLMDVRMPGVDGIEATRRIVAEFPLIRIIVLTTFDLDEYAIEAVRAGASGFLLKDVRAAELIAAVQSVAAGESVMSASVTARLLERLRDGANREGSPRGGAADSAPDSAIDGAVDGARAAADRREPPEAGANPLDALTQRELEVFELVAAGLTNPEIGHKLFLSESTVKTHISRILAKLHLRDRVHAVILAFELGVR